MHITAYVLQDGNYDASNDDDKQSQILNKNYLKDVKAYQDILDNNKTRRRKELNPLAAKAKTGRKRPSPSASSSSGIPAKIPRTSGTSSYQPEPGDAAPIAAYIRYKVLKVEKDAAGNEVLKKYFDYIFEGQSEFVDVNQFNIISHAVHFALGGKTALDIWYEGKK